ncbi:MAG TPA: hypothetical protein PK079_02710 [Leptospiraceae bacterium]|nr:hypothetical protein [Leptospiraceae bacterium]HMW04500.1 hypothetical protein [Leptospiraceae bacterium]HMX31158.1 hypothetical protein [Leptospiraceae bacterium]HMY30686.1 hypothetical protein [Leptospiraceae bacterium]HMZ63245.1 hypothetical protein [Leptospiraceae bacterium]
MFIKIPILVLLLSLSLNAQESSESLNPNKKVDEDMESSVEKKVTERKGRKFFLWGYNRSAYSQSDINFEGPGYKFTLQSVNASDKPEKIDSTYINPYTFDVPQFNWRWGKYITDAIYFSFGHDHMKYVMKRGQDASIYGYISPYALQEKHFYASPDILVYLYLFPQTANSYSGVHLGEGVKVTPDLLKFEHTDGLNYFSADIGITHALWESADGKHAFSINAAVGTGPVVLKSDVRLFGEGKNNKYNIGGYGVSGNVGFRFDFNKRYFIDTTVRGGYFDLMHVQTTGRSQDRANQNFYFMEIIAAVGYNIF